jgi:hypothetical protein
LSEILFSVLNKVHIQTIKSVLEADPNFMAPEAYSVWELSLRKRVWAGHGDAHL